MSSVNDPMLVEPPAVPEPPTPAGPFPPATLEYEPPVPPSEPVGPLPPGPGRRRPSRLVTGLIAVAALLAAVLALSLGARPSDPTGGAGFALPPTAPAASPSAPPSTPWPGTVPPPTPPPGSTPSATDPAGDGSIAGKAGVSGAAVPGAVGGDDAFCTAAGSALSAVGSHGAAALRALATGAGDAAPQARALVETTLRRVEDLRRATPAALKDAVAALDRAWSQLSAELARNGYDRTSLVVASVKFLADPALATAVDTVSRWVSGRCGPASATGNT